MTALSSIRLYPSLVDTAGDARIKKLETENAELRERLLQYEKDFLGAALILPSEWKLTKTEGRLTCLLLSREMVSKDQAMVALYRDRDPDHEPDLRIVDVIIHQIRRKMTVHGLRIETIWGQGYRIPEPCRTDFLHRIKPWSPDVQRRSA